MQLYRTLSKLNMSFDINNLLSLIIYNFQPNDSRPYCQFSVCRPEISAAECHPEEGIYSMVDEQRWRTFMSEDGIIEDELQLRKVI